MTPYVRIGMVLEVAGELAASMTINSWIIDTVDFFRTGYWVNITDRIISDFPEIEEGGERGWFKYSANDVSLTVVDEDEAVLAVMTHPAYNANGPDPYGVIADNVHAGTDFERVMSYLEAKRYHDGYQNEAYRINAHTVLEIYDQDIGINAEGLLYRGLCPYETKRTLSPNVTQEIRAYSLMAKHMQRRRVTLNPSDVEGAALNCYLLDVATIAPGEVGDVLGSDHWYIEPGVAAWKANVYVHEDYDGEMLALRDSIDSENVYAVKTNGSRSPQVLRIYKYDGYGDDRIAVVNEYGATTGYAYRYYVVFAMITDGQGEYIQPFGASVTSAPGGYPISGAVFSRKDNDRLVTLFQRPTLIEWFKMLAHKVRSTANVNHPMFADGTDAAICTWSGGNYGAMQATDRMVCDWYKPVPAETVMRELCKYSGGRWETTRDGKIRFIPRTRRNATWDIADEYIEWGDTLELDKYDENEHLLSYSLGDSLKLTENPDDPYDRETELGVRNNYYRSAFRMQPEYRSLSIPWTSTFAEIRHGDMVYSNTATGERVPLGRIMKIKWPNYRSDKGQMIELYIERRS